jgi:hypothetical protein
MNEPEKIEITLKDHKDTTPKIILIYIRNASLETAIHIKAMYVGNRSILGCIYGSKLH